MQTTSLPSNRPAESGTIQDDFRELQRLLELGRKNDKDYREAVRKEREQLFTDLAKIPSEVHRDFLQGVPRCLRWLFF